MDYINHIALVAGGSSGIGKACVAHLKRYGMKVVVWDLQEQQDAGADLFMQCDVSNEESVEKAMSQTISQLGTPRVCLNCAGIAPAKRMVGREGAMPLSEFKKVIDVNLIGTFNVMRVAAQAMSLLETENETEERGVIINTASIAAYEGQIGQTAYSASKGGVVSMTLPAARELARFAIRVNTIAPGLFATPMLLGMPQEVQEHLVASTLCPKRLGRPEEFASLVVQIMENQMINGAVIRLDGALRLQ